MTMSTIDCHCCSKTFKGDRSKCNLQCYIKLYAYKPGDAHVAFYIPRQAKSQDDRLKEQAARQARYKAKYKKRLNQKDRLRYYTPTAAEYLETVNQDNLIMAWPLTLTTIDPPEPLYNNPFYGIEEYCLQSVGRSMKWMQEIDIAGIRETKLLMHV
jgi:hypothetical protein